MPPISYPDLAWSGRRSRLRHTLGVIAIAVSVGAIGGSAGVLAVMGLPGGSMRAQSPANGKAPPETSPRAALTTPSTPSTTTLSPQSAPSQSSLAAALRQPPPPAQQQRQQTRGIMPQQQARGEGPQQQARREGPQQPSSFDQTPAAIPPASAKVASPAVKVQQSAAPVATHAALAEQRSHAAQNGQPEAKNLYDRVEPATSTQETSHQPVSSRTGRERRKSLGRRVSRPAVAEAPTPPVAIAPPRGYDRERQAEGYYGDRRDNRYYDRDDYDRDAWRDRRPDDGDDDSGRDSGPGNPIGALFGFLGGGDWR